MTEARHVVYVKVQTSVFNFIEPKIQKSIGLLKVDMSYDSLSIPGYVFLYCAFLCFLEQRVL